MIDLRSDTVTKPSQAMRKAMYEAEVGDDVYKEDPKVNELENYIAEILGKESSLFVPSGVMGNQICLNVHTQPGDEVICEADAHIFQYESGSPAVLSGLQLYPVKGINGIIQPETVRPLVRPVSAYYMPRSKVLEIENTHNRAGGTIYSIESIEKLKSIALEFNLKYHLDGARLWNASVATGVSLNKYCSDFIKEAFRVRKGWGGGMRQVGILAAAGLYAVKNNFERLAEDHEKAKILAKHIKESGNFEINNKNVQTNILIFKPKNLTVEEALRKCEENGLLLSIGQIGTLRAVTHMDVSFKDIEIATKILCNIIK